MIFCFLCIALMPKVHQYMSDPHLDPSKGLQGSILPKKDKIVFFQAHCIEVMLGEKVYRLYVFSYAKLKIFWNFYLTEKTEKILPIFVLEIFLIWFSDSRQNFELIFGAKRILLFSDHCDPYGSFETPRGHLNNQIFATLSKLKQMDQCNLTTHGLKYP